MNYLYTDGEKYFYHECISFSTGRTGYCCLYIRQNDQYKCYYDKCNFKIPSFLIPTNKLKYTYLTLGTYTYLMNLPKECKEIPLI